MILSQAFGIYIHWPYCLSKCPYCDFFSKVKKNIEQEKIIQDYLNDLDFYANLTSDKIVSSIFFGGGTPSLIKPQLLEKIINHISKKWSIAPNIEISLEANPNSEKNNLFNDIRSAGINRLSLGVQALNDADLKQLGRTHNLKQAFHAIDNVLKIFDNHSMDLIYARPNQSIEQWQQEIKLAASLGFKHLSMYQLTIEEGTVFYKKGLKAANEKNASEMYIFTNNYLRKNGYPQYEISNYAPKNFESSHNKVYWCGDDYIGIGPSAHGRLKIDNKIYALTHHRNMEEISAEERATELILMGLRLNRGINKKVFQKHCGLDFNQFINKQKLQHLQNEKLIIDTQQNIKATNNGRLLLNYLIEELCC